MRAILRLILFCALVLGTACSDDTPNRPKDGSTDGPHTTGDGPDPGKKLTWLSPETLDENNAGRYAAIAACGNVMGVAYFRKIPNVSKTCTGATRPGLILAADLYYVHYDGTSWGTPVKIDQVYGVQYGLGIAMDKSCKIYVGYLGGALGARVCESSDAMLATSSDSGKTWTKSTKSSAGTTGDTVGHWTTVAVDSKGAAHIAFRDVHFGYYEFDGNKKASLWYDDTSAANEAVKDNGGGVYARLVFDSKDSPVLLHYNGTQMDSYGGLQIVWKNPAWNNQQIVTGKIDELPSLGTDGKGAFGVAYYSKKQALSYLESKNMTTWSETQVDTTLTNNGKYSSVAFDLYGDPGISYYHCDDYAQTSCAQNKDSLRFAQRRKGTWVVYEGVDEGNGQRCGLYTALVYTPTGEPVIAYQCTSYDNTQGAWIDALKVIRGVYK